MSIRFTAVIPTELDTFVTRKRLSWPMLSTSGLLFMIVLTLARGNNTSFDLRGEFVGVGVLDTALRAADTGVVGVSSVMMILIWSAIDKKIQLYILLTAYKLRNEFRL